VPFKNAGLKIQEQGLAPCGGLPKPLSNHTMTCIWVTAVTVFLHMRHTHWKARDKLSRDRAPLVPGGHGNEPAVSAGTESSASALLFAVGAGIYCRWAGSSDADHSKVTLKIAH